MSTASTTSDKILASAKQLIVEGGYNGFSYADIAEVVGIRKASIHHHFSTKAVLAQELVAAHREEAEAALARLAQASDSGRAALSGYTGFWAACIRDASPAFCVGGMLASELPKLPEEVATEVRAFFAHLTGWTAAQMARGSADGSLCLSQPAATEAEAFVASVYGAMLLARAQGSPEIFHSITETSLRRLSPR